jgi:hypothetical protein
VPVKSTKFVACISIYTVTYLRNQAILSLFFVVHQVARARRLSQRQGIIKYAPQAAVRRPDAVHSQHFVLGPAQNEIIANIVAELARVLIMWPDGRVRDAWIFKPIFKKGDCSSGSEISHLDYIQYSKMLFRYNPINGQIQYSKMLFRYNPKWMLKNV